MIGSEIEVGGSIVNVEKVKNQDLIFITPKTKRIRALEELRRPQTKKDFLIDEMESYRGIRDTIDQESMCI